MVEWHPDGGQQAWLTVSVQLGFVARALLSTVFNLADRGDGRYLFAASACVGAFLNAAIAHVHLWDVGPGAHVFVGQL
jgi:hypothetical protein